MSEKKKDFVIPRPEFPKRAVITGGMPYDTSVECLYLPILTQDFCVTV